MESEAPSQCPLHGAEVSARSDSVGPLDVWLIDESDHAVHITTGSDWCLAVETSEPHAGYDMGDSGLVTMGALDATTPFAEHIGESVLTAREDFEPVTGRVALALSFRCESRAGDLRLTRRS
ncbi:hypothetical protein [Actinacidiphila glaucinigra]|uniref:hypothetical protein n=1 Tax=Actinacidiphila glaucinigra TaxID=235986 RepID=UPI0035DF81B4